jgi:hypothetical protein
MVRYLLFFEDRLQDREQIETLASRHFDAFTVRRGYRGFWQGIGENSAVVDIMADYLDRGKVYRLAEDIRQVASQSAVMVASYPLEVDFVTADTAEELISGSTHAWTPESVGVASG